MDFELDEELDATSPGGGGPEDGAPKDPKPAPKRRQLLPILLGALAFVVVAGGTFLYLGSLQEPEPAPAPEVTEAATKKPIALPQPPTVETPAGKAAAPAAPAESEPTPEEVVATKAVPAVQPAQEPATEMAPAPEAVAPKAEPVAAKPAPAEKAQTLMPKAEESPKVDGAAEGFTLRVGAYLYDSSAREAEKTVRGLGFEPVQTQIVRPVTMTRLRIGSFPLEEAKRKIEELSEVAPDAFYLNKGGEIVLYAASYFDVDKARVFADQIYAHDVLVEEETATVDGTLTVVSFGLFPSREAAQEAAAKANAAGVETQVSRVSAN